MCDVSSHDRLQTFSTCVTFVTICDVVPGDPNTVPGKFQFGNRSQILYLNISSSDVNDNRLPNDINVTFQTDTNISTELNLKRVDHITSNVPIYTIDTDEEGVKIKKEDVKGNENVAFYKDTRNDAVIQVFRQNGTDNQTGDFKITRGEYQQGNVRYSISPAVRSKRQTSEHSDQSDLNSERYDIRKIETPRETRRDYMTAPPEFESLKPGSLLNDKLQDGAKLSRSRRQSASTYYVDVTAFLDYSCYSRFMKDAYNYESNALSRIQEYYAFIFSGIDLIYQNFQASNIRLRVNLNKVLIFKSTDTFKLYYFYNYMYVTTTKVNTEAVLSKFTLFLNSPAGRDFSFPYDHAMLFVGSDLRTENGNILGLAWVKTLCRTDGASASVIEDMGDYSAIITGAHELGHSLAANHDGENNTCNYIDRYLMASSDSVPTYSTRLNPWRFSSCSIDSIVSYLISLADTARGQTCLSDALTVVGEFPDVSDRILGQKFPSDQQCQFKYGSSSYDCNPYLQNSTAELCYIYCKQPLSSYCYGQEALSGTSCGCGKVCRQGDCVIDLSVPSTGCDIFTNCTIPMCQDASVRRYCDRTCWYYKTLTTTVKEDICIDNYYVPSLNMTCRSALGESENLCYKLDVQTNCCVSCAQRLTNITGCEYGDRYKRLCSSIQSCKVYRDACCNTCRVVVGAGNRTFPDQILMLILNLTALIHFINFY
ncbi:Metalloprotease mig-17 [Bulinus truncatus]|nr:Metalloprotease mig-17 [Bulinus truncatus]